MAAAANVAPENQYFYEDVVYRVDKRGNVVFGIVMENDDQDMSEESSDSEESLPKRKKGEIRMIWHPSGVEELVNCKKVSINYLLVDSAWKDRLIPAARTFSYYLAYQHERRTFFATIMRAALESDINHVFLHVSVRRNVLMMCHFQVHLADRTLMPGDVVRRMIKGKDTQRGYCRDIELTACVQVIGSKQVLTDIKSEDLIPLQVH